MLHQEAVENEEGWAVICYAEAVSAERVAGLSKAEDCRSRYTVALGWLRKIEEGAIGLIGPSKQALMAEALRGPGTTARISLALRTWRTDMETACFGTASRFSNHPSASCCARQAWSRATMM